MDKQQFIEMLQSSPEKEVLVEDPVTGRWEELEIVHEPKYDNRGNKYIGTIIIKRDYYG